MDGVNIKLNSEQVALLIKILSPYVELSMTLSAQYSESVVRKQKPEGKPEERK